MTAIVFLCDEFLIPSHDRIDREQLCALFQHFPAKSFGFSRNSHPLTISQENPFVLFFLLFYEHTNLFTEVIDGFVEFFIDAIRIRKISDQRNP